MNGYASDCEEEKHSKADATLVRIVVCATRFDASRFLSFSKNDGLLRPSQIYTSLLCESTICPFLPSFLLIFPDDPQIVSAILLYRLPGQTQPKVSLILPPNPTYQTDDIPTEYDLVMAPAPVEAEEEAGQGAPSKRQGLILREGESRVEGRRAYIDKRWQAWKQHSYSSNHRY